MVEGRTTGHPGERHADARIRGELIGRNVIAGRWTFQVVEDCDNGYYAEFRQIEEAELRQIEELARTDLAQGRRHLFEVEMKERRRTHGWPGHEARPTASMG